MYYFGDSGIQRHSPPSLLALYPKIISTVFA